jgi:hypothetical protein
VNLHNLLSRFVRSQSAFFVHDHVLSLHRQFSEKVELTQHGETHFSVQDGEVTPHLLESISRYFDKICSITSYNTPHVRFVVKMTDKYVISSENIAVSACLLNFHDNWIIAVMLSNHDFSIDQDPNTVLIVFCQENLMVLLLNKLHFVDVTFV